RHRCVTAFFAGAQRASGVGGTLPPRLSPGGGNGKGGVPIPCCRRLISSRGLPLVSQWSRAATHLGLRRGQTARRPPGYFMRAEPYRDCSIQQLVHSHITARQGVPPATLFDLQGAVVQRNRVVCIHPPLVQDREHPRQILP